ncbi:hypothetical protein THRCLA_21701 [Thraustotheca clavata]|uniref:Chromo domain-containing protein n=1 Tax=Thraustotheca clavata TaxID=74557 RepID=A0A1V9ZQL0_9STRA|nr:hypothetical protein THRCLA_21701 [Thraustotheca clavata]
MIQEDELPDHCGDLLVSRCVMHRLGYDPTSLLQKAGEIRRIWDFADIQPADPASGLPRVGAIMAAPTATIADDPVYDGLETSMPTPDSLNVQRREVHRVHAARLKIFHNASKELSTEMLDAIDFSAMVTEVDHFTGYRINDAGVMELDTVWLGIEVSSWEPVCVMAEDVYLKYKQYMMDVAKTVMPGTMAHNEFTAILREFPIDASSQYSAKAARQGRTQRKRVKKAQTTAKTAARGRLP